MTKIRQWSTLAVCALFLFGLPLWHLLSPDEEFSKSERRRLEQLPELTLSGVVGGEYFEEMEDYLLDQFPKRDAFRSVKSVFSFSVLRQKDVGGLYRQDGHLGKLETALDEAQFSYGIRKLNEVREALPKSCAVYYAVIPDKNVYLAQPNGYPHIDYDDMLRRLREGLENMTEIPLFDLLDANDYYRTDAHWRQDGRAHARLVLLAAAGALPLPGRLPGAVGTARGARHAGLPGKRRHRRLTGLVA